MGGYLRCLATALAIVLSGCSVFRRDSAANTAACNALAKRLTDQEKGFVAHARSIRAEHVYMQDYDRQMIDVINRHRAAIEATKLTALTVEDEVAGCSGPQLDALRHRAQTQMSNLRSFLSDFNRALRSDPEGVYINQP
jgi:hypothetical protein